MPPTVSYVSCRVDMWLSRAFMPIVRTLAPFVGDQFRVAQSFFLCCSSCMIVLGVSSALQAVILLGFTVGSQGFCHLMRRKVQRMLDSGAIEVDWVQMCSPVAWSRIGCALVIPLNLYLRDPIGLLFSLSYLSASYAVTTLVVGPPKRKWRAKAKRAARSLADAAGRLVPQPAPGIVPA